jgi:hypothetical protein
MLAVLLYIPHGDSHVSDRTLPSQLLQIEIHKTLDQRTDSLSDIRISEVYLLTAINHANRFEHARFSATILWSTRGTGNPMLRTSTSLFLYMRYLSKSATINCMKTLGIP